MTVSIGAAKIVREPIMRLPAGLSVKTCLAISASVICALIAQSPVAFSQGHGGNNQTPVIEIGHAAISAFAGALLAGDGIPPGVDPIDRTVIDLDGSSIAIFDFRTLRGPLGRGPVSSPARLEVPSRAVGQVFGLAFDAGIGSGAPNLYAGATSAFGVHIVAGSADPDGAPIRLKSGAPGARFMPGQFGGEVANPGAIWRVDGTTGIVSLFADTSSAGIPNSGPGIGALAFDRRSGTLYASDLDTGLIHRFSIDGPSVRFPTFDHGIVGRSRNNLPAIADDGRRMDISSPSFRPNDSATWGFTQPERRVHGLAVHGGRLYYAVAVGAEVWSIALNPDGSFGDDVGFEFRAPAAPSRTIASMAFDGQGRVTLAMRDAPTGAYDYVRLTEGSDAPVLRYARRQDGTWSAEPDSYTIGNIGDGSNASGGVGFLYGFGANGSLDVSRCDSTLVATADALSSGDGVAGLQISPAQSVRPSNAANQAGTFALRQSVFPDARGHVGGLAVYQPCGGHSNSILADAAPSMGASPPPIFDPGSLPPIEDRPLDFPPVVVLDPGPDLEITSQAGQLELTKRAIGNACDPTSGKGCDFEITITNKGPGSFNGPVSFSERITGDGALFNASQIVNGPTPPWACAKVNETFTCSRPDLALAPNAKTTILIGVSLGSAAASPKVAVLRNCAQLIGSASAACADITIGQPPPVNAGNLTIEKNATVTTCSALGGGCSFEIIVTNSGTTAFTGPIVVNDTTRTLRADGTALGTASMGGIAPNAPWSCSPSSDGATCVSPATTTLQPGGKIRLTLSFIPGASGASGSRVENCARLQSGGPQACASILLSQAQGPKLRPEKTYLSGDCATGCDFNIRVQNVGNAPYSGEITLLDVVTEGSPAGTQVQSQVLQASSPWLCTSPQPGFHHCRLPAPVTNLQPGAFTGLTMRLKLDRVKFDGFNCAVILSTPARVRDNEQAGRCAPISIVPSPIVKVDPPPVVSDTANLSAEMDVLSRDCHIDGPCNFVGGVRNAGPIAYTGKLVVFNTVLPQRPANMRDAQQGTPWTCAPGGDPPAFLRCETSRLTLPPNHVVAFIPQITPGEDWTKGNILKNCLKIGYDPAGNDKGQIKSDDEACADIIVDPYAVTLEKSGSQSCVAGESCRFDLTIFNPAQILHDAPVTITDGTNGLPPMPIISISEPLPCATQPTQIPFTCSSAGNVQFPVGYRKVHTVTVHLPASPAVSEFTNCAWISPPKGAATRQDNIGASGCHTVRVEPARAAQSPAATCSGGMVLSANGRCACPQGTEWSGRSCVSPRPTSSSSGSDAVKDGDTVCPRGRPVGRPPNCCPLETQFINGACRRPEQKVETRPECPRSRPIGVPPNCCPVGTVFERGACRAERAEQTARCAPTMIGSPPNCRCPDGTRFDRGACRPPPLPPPPPPPQKQQACPSGMSGSPPNCQCPAGMRYVRGFGGSPPRCVPAPVQAPPPKRPPPPIKVDPKSDPGQILLKCAPYQIGNFPNCRCPPRTTGPRCDQPLVR